MSSAAGGTAALRCGGAQGACDAAAVHPDTLLAAGGAGGSGRRRGAGGLRRHGAVHAAAAPWRALAPLPRRWRSRGVAHRRRAHRCALHLVAGSACNVRTCWQLEGLAVFCAVERLRCEAAATDWCPSGSQALAGSTIRSMSAGARSRAARVAAAAKPGATPKSPIVRAVTLPSRYAMLQSMLLAASAWSRLVGTRIACCRVAALRPAPAQEDSPQLLPTSPTPHFSACSSMQRMCCAGPSGI